MSEAQTITSKSIAEALDEWQITGHAPELLSGIDATAEPLVQEEEHSERFSAAEPPDATSQRFIRS